MGVTIRHVIFSEEWQALYVDGQVVEQGTTINARDLVEQIENVEIDEATSEYSNLEVNGDAPDKYSDLEFRGYDQD